MDQRTWKHIAKGVKIVVKCLSYMSVNHTKISRLHVINKKFISKDKLDCTCAYVIVIGTTGSGVQQHSM
jgi:hypothetical protein